MAGIQMEFEEEVDDAFIIEDVSGYRLAISKELYSETDYLEVKYSDNFLVRGFYISKNN